MKLADLALSFLVIFTLIPLLPIPANIGATHATATKIYVDRCMDIVESGYYELIGNISGTQLNARYCIRILANNVVLDGKGYAVRYPTIGSSWYIGVMISKSSNITIRNIAISRYGVGISISNSSHVTITSSNVNGCVYGISVHFSEDVNIVGNSLNQDYDWGTWNPVVGVYVEHSKNVRIEQNTIDNRVYGCCGILLNFSNYVIVHGNKLVVPKRSIDGIALMKSNYNTITNNIVDGCGSGGGVGKYRSIGAGIRLIDSHENFISENSVRECKNYGYAIIIEKSNRNQIEKNALFNSVYGIAIIKSNHSIIFSNRIINNSVRGIYIESSTNNNIYNNYMFNNVNVEARNVSFNTWNAELSQGTNIIGGQWIGGNAWLKPDERGYSQVCRDELEPIGICDEPYYIAKDNIDYYPLSTKVKQQTPTPTTIPMPTPTPIYTPTSTLTISTPVLSPTAPSIDTKTIVMSTPTPSPTQAQVIQTPTSTLITPTTPITVQTTTSATLYIDIDVKLDSIDYVLLNKTASVPVIIHNKGGLPAEVVLMVKTVYGFLEITYPLGNLTIRVSPYQSQVVNVILRGVREGEEILIVSTYTTGTGDRVERSLKIPVTMLRTVYVNVSAGFYLPLPPMEFYRRPISSGITLCGVRASYIGGNKYVVEVPKIYRTCTVKVEDPIGITSALYEEVVSIADSIDVVIPDTYISLTLLAISWMLLAPLYLSVKQAFGYTINAISFFIAINIVTVVVMLIKPSLFPGFYTTLTEILTIIVAGSKLAAIKMDQYKKKKAEKRKAMPTELKEYEKIRQEVISKPLSCVPKKDYSKGFKVQVPGWIKQVLKVDLPDVMHLIGRGAQGCVYACGNYAIKVPLNLCQDIEIGSKSPPTISSRFIDNFKKETELVQKLDHDNILRLVDYSVNPPILVYELAHGNLEDCGRLNLRDVLQVAIQISKALRYLHSRGVVHGDLKPSNILIVNGVVKIGDLSSLNHLLATASGSYQSVCTPGYCAPEQLFIDLRSNPKRKGYENRVDVYQLANVILTMLGINPIDGSEWDGDEISKRIENIEIEELKDLVKAMLVKEPWLRPSIDEVEKGLLMMWEKRFGSRT